MLLYGMLLKVKGGYNLSFKKWLETHNLITYKQYLRDIMGVTALLLIIFGVSLYKMIQLQQSKTKIYEMNVLEKQHMVTLKAINDYYTGDISREFKTAKYIIDIRTNVFSALGAINRFMPVIMGNDTPFTTIDIVSIIMTESTFNPKAISPKKAMGIMQIMNHQKYITEVDGVKSPFDINCSVKAGLECLQRKYELFGDKKKAIIAYWGVVKRKDGSWEDEYYNKVMENKAIIQKVLSARTD